MESIQLVIKGPEASQRLRYSIEPGAVMRLGRATQVGLDVPWDLMISREYADIQLLDDSLFVRVLDAARNPLTFNGESVREATVPPGGDFRVGSTQFRVVAPSSAAPNSEVGNETIDPEKIVHTRIYREADLLQSRFGDAQKQMEALAELPDLISSTSSDAELAAVVAQLLLKGIQHAVAVEAAEYDMSQMPADDSIDNFPAPVMSRIEARANFRGSFRPSRRMILHALTKQTALLQVWNDSESQSHTFTMIEGLDWAFVTPIRGDTCKGWCLYLAGRGGLGGTLADPERLEGDLRFVELVAQFIASVRQVRVLQAEKTQLSSFFSPSVTQSLLDQAGDEFALQPSLKQISVLFCDVRGFSRRSEQSHDLLQLLETVRVALGHMAGGILDNDGTIADYQGDSALGFWGWPVELEDGPVPACRAALDIFLKFWRDSQGEGENQLQGLSIGMGIAHGLGVAGEIGTEKQAKVGVFGPIVNQGARLEGMTKQFGIPICIDEATAKYIKDSFGSDDGHLRRLARVYPKGMDVPVMVYGLVPSQFKGYLPDIVELHDEAVTCFIEGRWSEAEKRLAELPQRDGPSAFLRKQILRYKGQPPENWDGAISLTEK